LVNEQQVPPDKIRALGQLLPEIADHTVANPDLQPEQARFQLLESVRTLLDTISRETPIVLILEDLHAADSDSLQLLQYVARHAASMPLLLIGTYRDAEEAIGIAQAAAANNVPVVIGFTTETDGRLPSGQTLQSVIEQVDEATNNEPAYYMINCAHTDHFSGAIADNEEWPLRIRGIRANASRCSHAELDESETLDDGDPIEFGQLYRQLCDRFPQLTVLGGCCGTDHRHIQEVSLAVC
jgi:S-methylmethionine-dependent homocysteine/selenocysteine methylase